MGRRSDHSRDEIKAMALDQARTIVHEQGLAALSARRVATGIGYTVGTLYLVFRNLDELVLHMNARTLDEMHDHLQADSQRCRKPENCVLALAHSYIDFATKFPNLWGAVFEHRLPDSESSPHWYRERVERLFTLVEQALMPLTKQRSKEVRLASRALWGGVHGICILGLTGALANTGVEDVRNLVDSLIKNYLVGYVQ